MGRRWWAGPGLGRPGPARQIFRGWAAARPSPSHFQIFTARPGPSHGSEAHETRALYGLARQLRGPAHVLSRTKRCMCICYVYCFFFCFFPVWIPWDSCFRPVNLTVTGRPMCCPGLKGACAYAKFIAGFSLFVPSLDSVGQLLSARGFDGPAHVLSRTKGCMCICYVYCCFFVDWSPSGFRGTATLGP